MAGLTDGTFSLRCLSWVWGLWNNGHIAPISQAFGGVHETVTACTPSFPESRGYREDPTSPNGPSWPPNRGPHWRGPGWGESELMPGPGGSARLSKTYSSGIPGVLRCARPASLLQKVTFWTEHCSWLWATPWPLPHSSLPPHLLSSGPRPAPPPLPPCLPLLPLLPPLCRVWPRWPPPSPPPVQSVTGVATPSLCSGSRLGVETFRHPLGVCTAGHGSVERRQLRPECLSRWNQGPPRQHPAPPPSPPAPYPPPRPAGAQPSAPQLTGVFVREAISEGVLWLGQPRERPAQVPQR